jgi:hypothetical protein
MEVLGEHNGTDVHDRHSAFETLAKETGNNQQYCWSHIICDAKELEQFYGEEGSGIKRPFNQYIMRQRDSMAMVPRMMLRIFTTGLSSSWIQIMKTRDRESLLRIF